MFYVQVKKRQVGDLDVTKAVGPDKIIPHILVTCADQLVISLATLFQSRMLQIPKLEDCCDHLQEDEQDISKEL